MILDFNTAVCPAIKGKDQQDIAKNSLLVSSAKDILLDRKQNGSEVGLQ